MRRTLVFFIISLALVAVAPAQEKEEEPPALFPVVKDGKCGYIDRTGKVIIEPQFHSAFPFSEGLAALEIDGKFGFIDTAGKIAIKPQYDCAFDFREGLAAVRIGRLACAVFADVTYGGELDFAVRTEGLEVALRHAAYTDDSQPDRVSHGWHPFLPVEWVQVSRAPADSCFRKAADPTP